MNKFITKLAKLTLGLAMAAGVGVAFGGNRDVRQANAAASSITFTTSASNLGYSSGTASNKSMTVSGVTITFSSITGKTNSPARVQVPKNGTITSTVFADSITSITLNNCAHTGSKSDGSFTVSCSANGSSWTQVYSTSTMSPSQGNVPITGITSGYKYFKVTVGSSRVLQLSGIVVNYGSDSTPYTTTVNVTGGALSTKSGHSSTSFSSTTTSGNVYLTPSSGYQIPSSGLQSAFSVSGGTKGTLSSDNGDLVIPITQVTGNVTITGSFELIPTYTIAYNANGGSGTMSSTTGTNPAVAACTFTAPSSKQFSYWHTTSSGTGGTTYAVGDTPKANLTLYAIWVNQKTLSGISVSTAPTTTTYVEGEYFDPTGLVITRSFDDSSSDTYTYSGHTSEFSFNPDTSTALTTSDTSVTISYGGKSTTQVITVNEVTKYELITDATGLVAGCDYLIGNASQTKFMSTTQNGNNRGVHTLSGSVSDNKVGFEEGMEVVTLGGSSGAWTLYANNSETAGYLYLPSNNNYLRTQASAFNWGISFSSGTPSISATVTSQRWIKYNSSSSIFSCYTSGQENISLWKEVSTAESIDISKDSVSGFKGDSDNTVSITASNFTPTNIEVSYSTSGVASVTKGTISEGVIPLNVSYTGVGD